MFCSSHWMKPKGTCWDAETASCSLGRVSICATSTQMGSVLAKQSSFSWGWWKVKACLSPDEFLLACWPSNMRRGVGNTTWCSPPKCCQTMPCRGTIFPAPSWEDHHGKILLCCCITFVDTERLTSPQTGASPAPVRKKLCLSAEGKGNSGRNGRAFTLLTSF